MNVKRVYGLQSSPPCMVLHVDLYEALLALPAYDVTLAQQSPWNTALYWAIHIPYAYA